MNEKKKKKSIVDLVSLRTNCFNTFCRVGKTQRYTKYSFHSVFIHVLITHCSTKPASAMILQILHFELKSNLATYTLVCTGFVFN